MDQVRFELTSSRVRSEVTLPYTTSNSGPPPYSSSPPTRRFFHVAAKFQPGGTIEQTAEPMAPLRLPDEVFLPSTIPVSLPVGTFGPRLCLELPLFGNGRVSLPVSPSP